MGLTMRVRAGVPRGLWDEFVAGHPDGWVWQLSDWLDYLASWGAEDRSFAFLEGGRILAAVPLLTPGDPFDPGPEPLVEGSGGVALPQCYRCRPQRGVTPMGFWTRVIDLRREDAELWREMRRSYHSLIHGGERRYTVGRADGLDELRALYDATPTLPQIPAMGWPRLRALHNAQILRTYVARSNETGLPVGAVAVYAWKRWSYYGHGRSLEPNVNHLLHWYVMRALREDVDHYEIGWEARPEDDAKAQAIAFHKAGFGGERWWVPVR